MIIMFVLAVLFLVIGWGIEKKQWYFLISGYNMMSESEKAKVNIKGLAKLISRMCYIIAILLIALGLFMQFELYNLLWIIITLVVIVSIGVVIYSRKFYPNGMSMSGTTSPKAKKFSILFTTITLVGVGIIIYFSMQPTKYTIETDTFLISGMYGDEMTWSEINGLQLVDTLPSIAARTNGSAVGSKLKGNFKFKDGTKAILFVDKNVGTFITFTWKDNTYYINEPTVEETNTLFKKMEEALK